MSADYPIEFHYENTSFKLEKPDSIRTWIKRVIALENSNLKHLNYIFSSDDYLLKINREYLNHDYYTDVITFPLSDENVEGDIFISIDRVRENAKELDVPECDELNRVIVHGVLHLLGYRDKSKIDKSVMKLKEDTYMDIYNNNSGFNKK